MAPKFVYRVAILVGALLTIYADAQENGKEAKNEETAPETIKQLPNLGLLVDFQTGPPPKRKRLPEIGMLLEYFEVDHRVANKLVSRFSPRASDAKELRTILGEMVEKGEATLVETSWLRGRNGQRVKTESIAENIFPTEYDPPQIPNSVGDRSSGKNTKEGRLPPIYMAAAFPTAFETWNAGLTVEVDPVLSDDLKSVYINLGATILTRLEDRHFTRPGREASAWGIDNISMSTFYRMSSRAQTLAISGNYNLQGLFAPPGKPSKRIIHLLKVDVFPTN